MGADQPMLNHLNTAEKIGIFGLLGGFFVALVKAVRLLAFFSDERQRVLRHIEETEPLIPRLILLEAANEEAKRERQELIDEVRGLRKDLMDYIMGRYGPQA